MYSYAILIAYQGTHFSGWQIQNNGISIQHLITQALHQISRQQAFVIGSGRTDAGVHAEGQVAHFRLPLPLEDESRTLRSLNALLPPEIRILKIARVERSFHARYRVQKKIYRYRLDLSTFSDPFERFIRTHVGPLAYCDEMIQAALLLTGEHDFKAFANDNEKGAAAKNSVRTIEKVEFQFPDPHKIDIDWHGEGFLYKMVRNLMGTLITIGKGKMKKEEIPSLLASLDRRRCPPSAPAKGLTLMKVFYDPDPFAAKGPSCGIEQNESNTATFCF